MDNISQENIQYQHFCMKMNELTCDFSCPSAPIAIDGTPIHTCEERMKEMIPNKECGEPKPNENYMPFFIENGPNNIFYNSSQELWIIQSSIALTLINDLNGITCLACNMTFEELNFSDYTLHMFTNEHIQNLNILEAKDKELDNHVELYSELKLKSLMLYYYKNKLMCCLCRTSVMDTDARIQEHINNSHHKMRAFFWKHGIFEELRDQLKKYKDLWYYFDKIYCELCMLEFSSEVAYVNHLNTMYHCEKKTTAESLGYNIKYAMCRHCYLVWYGYPCFLNLHLQSHSHFSNIFKRTYKVPDMPLEAITLISQYEHSLKELIELNYIQGMKYCNLSYMIEIIESIIQPEFPDVIGYLIGPLQLGLFLQSNEVEVFLDCGGMFEGHDEKAVNRILRIAIIQFSNSAQWILLNKTSHITHHTIIAHNEEWNITFKLTFSNGLQAMKTNLLRCFASAFPICHELILFLTKWVELCKLDVKTQFTTEIITWLIIFYLQNLGIIPSIYSLIKESDHSRIINGCETGIFVPIRVETFGMTFHHCLMSFFSFYSTFDYKKYVICPLTGVEVHKKTFLDSKYFPEEFSIYQRYLKRKTSNGVSRSFSINSPFCLQDPIELSNNLTSKITKMTLRTFIQYCSKGLKLMKNME